MKSLKVRTEKVSLALRMANYVGVLMVVAALGFSTANAASVSPFFDAGFECQNAQEATFHGCFPTPPSIYASIWNTGDFFGENFTSTGLASVFQLSLHTLINNALAVGQTEIFNVSVNASVVGSVSVPGAGTGAGTLQTLMQSFTFGAISGPAYDVRFTVTSTTIGPLLGSVGFNHDGVSSSVTLTQAPEPGTMLLLGVGLFGLVVRRMRKA